MTLTGVNIIGTGNVAYHLAHALKIQGVPLNFIAGRSISIARKLAKSIDSQASSIEDLPVERRLNIICVSDDAVSTVSAMLPEDCAVVHTAGVLSINELRQEHRGIFYPLQSFSRNREPDWKRIPICIESNSPELLSELKLLSDKLTQYTTELDIDKRKRLHIAAVVVNNFVNHLYRLASDWMQEQDLDPQLLKPLVLETTLKAMELGPAKAQTGPARRKDIHTINTHLEMLQDDPQLASLYEIITEDILKTYHEH